MDIRYVFVFLLCAGCTAEVVDNPGQESYGIIKDVQQDSNNGFDDTQDTNKNCIVTTFVYADCTVKVEQCEDEEISFKDVMCERSRPMLPSEVIPDPAPEL